MDSSDAVVLLSYSCHIRYKGVTAMLRILVVEDDQDNADSLATLLRLYGHQVDVSTDGPSALQAVKAAEPDVVLLDLGLPKLDGWQVAQQIRQHRKGKRRPLIIAVIGYGDKPSRLRSYESGIDLHLTKPVDPTYLQDLLKQYRRILKDFGIRSDRKIHSTVLLPSPAEATSRVAPDQPA